jgi:RNase_H superfamily/Transposase IS66 family
LQALAIRKNKIHAVDLLAPTLDGTPVYLDVEGVPDSESYYLIGIRVGTGDAGVQYSFWANDPHEEKGIWNDFLGALSKIPSPRLIHYGNYETVFLNRMRKRHGEGDDSAVTTVIKNATNLNSLIFAHIYFPTFSNGLKDIAGYLGFQWSGSPASGLEAIVWRHRWEVFKDPAVKQALLDYNRQDCNALEIVARKLVELHTSPEREPSQAKIVYASDIKRESPYSFKSIAFALPEMELINKAAYWDYQRERVYVKSHRNPKRSGVLVSDFYAAYDVIDCPQQKCLIHFIRDLNDALLTRPFDEELRELARTFSGLVKPMVETVDRRGLKRRYLAKHRGAVERFYKLISHSGFGGEESGKLVERLQKNRRKMFTFLDFDDVPWNNNNAEHAVKAFVTLRRVIDGSTTEEGLRNYLVLLSICETCKYTNIDFLDFLRSGSKDIDDFAGDRWKQSLRGTH